jgi:GT2 family glycosyltransferase
MGIPLVSLVTLTYNREKKILSLLQRLRNQTYRNVEIIVINNDPAEGVSTSIKRDFAEVNLIRTRKNLGMVAYNLGFEEAKGKYIVTIDDDGLPDSNDWIERLVRCFEDNPKLGAACCTIRMQDTGQIAHDSPQFIPEGNSQLGYPAVAYNGTGAALRTAALREVGYYPEPYFINYLELHLCTRLIQSGWKVRHFPDIEVWHSRKSGSSFPARSRRGLRNYLWYVLEFYPWPDVVQELLHEKAYRMKLCFKGQLSFQVILSALVWAIYGAPDLMSQRKPVSQTVLSYLQEVRRCGNWYDLSPKIRKFTS